MKKNYLAPNLEVILIASQQLLAGSITQNTVDAVDMNSGEFGSREFEEELDTDIFNLLNM